MLLPSPFYLLITATTTRFSTAFLNPSFGSPITTTINTSTTIARVVPPKTNNGNEPTTESTTSLPFDKRTVTASVRYALLNVAAAVLSFPIDCFTTPPMIDPCLPSTNDQRRFRDKVGNILVDGWGYLDDHKDVSGNEREEEEEDATLVDKRMNAQGTGHTPSTYGEVTELGARQLFYYMGMTNTQTTTGGTNDGNVEFVDLGSGHGKLIVQAFMELPRLVSAKGIELSPSRSRIANTAWESVRDRALDVRSSSAVFENSHSNSSKTPPTLPNNATVALYRGDLFSFDLSSTTHIYVASLCFTDSMMERFAQKVLRNLERGGERGTSLRCIATLRRFPAQFLLPGVVRKVEERWVEMSWTKPRGTGCLVYLYWLDRK